MLFSVWSHFLTNACLSNSVDAELAFDSGKLESSAEDKDTWWTGFVEM